MFTEFNTKQEQVALLKAQTIFGVKTSDVVGPLRHLGITPKAEFTTMGLEVAEVGDPRRFTGLPYKRISKKIAPEFSFDLHEVSMENLALCHLGVVDELTQTATEVQNEALGATGNRGIFVGAIFQLANPNVDTTKTVTIETDEQTPVAFDEYDPSDGTGHYKLHALPGLVEIVAIPATATVGDPIRATYTPVAMATGAGMKRIKAGTETRVEGRLILIGESGEGAKFRLTIWNCYVELDGAFSYVTDDPAKYTIKITVLSDDDHEEPFELLQLEAA